MKSKIGFLLAVLLLAALPLKVGATQTPRPIFATSIYNGAGNLYIPTVTPLAHRACYFDGSNTLAASSTTDAELAFVHLVTGPIQAQLNALQPAGAYLTGLSGDVSATGPGIATATVNSIGGSSAANVHSAELAANAAASANTASTLVKRDGSGNFSAGTILAALTGNVTGNLTGNVSGNVTGNLTGNVTGNVSGSAASFTGSLAGDVTGTQSATAISAPTVTGKTLTGFVSGAGSVSSADSILSAIDKLDGNIAAKITGPGSAVNGQVATFNGTTGNLARASSMTVDPTNGFAHITNAASTSTPGAATLIKTGEPSTPGQDIEGTIRNPVSELPTVPPGLYAWYEADTGLPSNGSGVATWSDQSGNGRDALQATGGNQLTYLSNIVNGRGVVRGDGTNKWLGVASAYPSEATVIMVFRSPTITDQALFSTSTDVGHPQDGGPTTIFRDLDLTFNLYSSGSTPAGSFTQNAFHVLAVTMSVLGGATGNNVYIDGVQALSGSPNGGIRDNAAMIIGCGYYGCYNGDLGEVVIYNQILSGIHLANVTAYEGAKFNISVAGSVDQTAYLSGWRNSAHALMAYVSNVGKGFFAGLDAQSQKITSVATPTAPTDGVNKSYADALAPLATKGDLLGYSTLNARIPVGSNGQVLTADSTQTPGVKWATPASDAAAVTYTPSSSANWNPIPATVAGGLDTLASRFGWYSGTGSPASANVSWSTLVNISAVGSVLRSTTGGSFDGVAYSSATFAGDVSLTVAGPANGGSLVCGLTAAYTGTPGFATIRYGLYRDGGTVNYFENGTNMGVIAAYSASDIWGVKRVGNTVVYQVNGSTLATSGQSAIGLSLFPICSLGIAMGLDAMTYVHADNGTTIGVNGDFYRDTVANNVWAKSGGTWANVGNLAPLSPLVVTGDSTQSTVQRPDDSAANATDAAGVTVAGTNKTAGTGNGGYSQCVGGDSFGGTGGYCYIGGGNGPGGDNPGSIIATGSGVTAGTPGTLSLTGHLITSNGTVPTVTAGCGTSPSVSGSDTVGVLNIGTGGTATSCTLTFGVAFGATPHCFVNDRSEIISVRAVPTTATLVISKTTPFAASSLIDYWCVQ